MQTNRITRLLFIAAIFITAASFTRIESKGLPDVNRVIADTTPKVLKTVAMLPVSMQVAAAPLIAFKANATQVGGMDLPNATYYKVDFGGTLFNEGNCFSKETDDFIAPLDGYYHFDLRVSWLKFSAMGLIDLQILINWHSALPAATIQIPSTSLSVFDSNFGALVKLKRGDKVTVEIKQNSGATQKFQQVQLSGFKVN